MKFYWSVVLCISMIHVASAIFPFLKEKFDSVPKPGLLDFITKPKIPGIQIGSHIGPGSFGFGFGIGGHFGSSATGANLPPKEKEYVKPEDPWKDGKKEIMRPRPNWEDKEDPNPELYEDTKYKPYEDKKDPRPDWEEIGEDQDQRSEDLLDGDLVGDGLIEPRIRNRNRNKRFIDSKVYHVPLRFLSNAKPYQVKIRSHPNSLND